MNKLIAIIIAGLIALGVLKKLDLNHVNLTDPEITLDYLYERHGLQKGVDWMLLKAIARVESSENPRAKNPLDPSIGLMQILCQPDGQGGCKNRFHILDWPPESEAALYDPDLNIHFGSQILAWNVQTYGLKKGVAVYNCWDSRLDPASGPFRNQRYVDKVFREYSAIKAD
jgi:soluble lytic murein transglycosylase-like protein